MRVQSKYAITYITLHYIILRTLQLDLLYICFYRFNLINAITLHYITVRFCNVVCVFTLTMSLHYITLYIVAFSSAFSLVQPNKCYTIILYYLTVRFQYVLCVYNLQCS